MLIRMECGLDITEKILKFDGRPFFYDELLALLRAKLDSHQQQRAIMESRNDSRIMKAI
jgi:2-oxoglutarate/2-oxoacid ferredoxin oxidoreductase subunit alpha